MEIRVLKYFLAVASTGSVTEAAKMLHITQPTLSRQLMQLEEELGVALFMRTKRKMLLTENGLLLKRRAEEIMSLARRTEIELSHQTSLVNGNIGIGCGITKATEILGQMIKDYLDKYPEVTLSIKNGNTDLVLENLENGLIDIGIVLDPVGLEKYNYLKLKEKERWGVLVSKDCELAKQSSISPQDLKTLPLISSSRQELRLQLQEWCQDEKLRFIASYDIITQALFLVKNSHVGAVVVEGAMHSVNSEGLVFVPFFPEMTSTSYVVWKKYQSYSLTVSKFIDFLSENEKLK